MNKPYMHQSVPYYCTSSVQHFSTPHTQYSKLLSLTYHSSEPDCFFIEAPRTCYKRLHPYPHPSDIAIVTHPQYHKSRLVSNTSLVSYTLTYSLTLSCECQNTSSTAGTWYQAYLPAWQHPNTLKCCHAISSDSESYPNSNMSGVASP